MKTAAVRLTKQFNMRLSDAEREKLQKLARQSGVNPPDLVRHWIRVSKFDADLGDAIEKRRNEIKNWTGDGVTEEIAEE